MIKFLHELDQDTTPTVEPKKSSARLDRPTKYSNGDRINHAHRSGGKVEPITLEICERVKALKEPFRAGDVMRVAGVTQKKASNFITQGKVKGWLIPVGAGEYNRSKTFGLSRSETGSQMLRDIHTEIEAKKTA